jgi:prepilin-type N-terminal cleavage/methylation domain-containing protein
MIKPIFILKSNDGFTMIELAITVAIIAIILGIAAASYDTLQNQTRASKAKGDMDAIAQAGYTDFSYNSAWDVMTLDGTIPPHMAAEGLLSQWPVPPCPGMTYTWENFSPGTSMVRVGLRRIDASELWSYCLDVNGGGNCEPVDPISGTIPIEISTTKVTELTCDE